MSKRKATFDESMRDAIIHEGDRPVILDATTLREYRPVTHETVAAMNTRGQRRKANDQADDARLPGV